MKKLLKKSTSILLCLCMVINGVFILPLISYAETKSNNSQLNSDELLNLIDNKNLNRDFQDMSENQNLLESVNGNELMVKYKDDVSETNKKEHREEVGAKLIEKGKDGIELIKIENASIDKAVDKLDKNSDIESVSPNFIRKVLYTPNDEKLSEQWSVNAINADKAWDILDNTENLKEIKVAVIDTGVDTNHEDLKGKLTDDGYDFCDNDNDPMSGPIAETHATHVSGIIAAMCDNNIGVTGLTGKAPIKIMPLRTLKAGNGDDFAITKAVYYAVEHNADIINMSFGSIGRNDILEEAINYAISKGVLVVAAAGNSTYDSKYFWPAGVPGVVTVSATDSENKAAEFTNYGSGIEIAAPGVDVLSTVNGDKYEKYSGTSMSCPTICAVAAMIKSKNPEYNIAQIQDVLYNSSKDLGDKGIDKAFGYGLVDAEKALNTSPSDKKVKLIDVMDNDRVFYSTDFNVNYNEPQNLKNIEFYIDDIKIDDILAKENTIQYKSTIDLNKFDDGKHTLKVLAYDLNGVEYEDTRIIDVSNNVGNGLRIKTTTNGKACQIAQYSIFEKNEASNGKYEQTQMFIADRKGYVDISEDMINNKNDYLLIGECAEGTTDGYSIYYNIQQMNKMGYFEFENSNLTEINIESIGEESSEVVAFKLLNDGSKIDYGLICKLNISNFSTVIKKCYISPGKYEFKLKADKLNNNNMEGYLLTKVAEVKDSPVNNISFDVKNLAKINTQYNKANGWNLGQKLILFDDNIFISDILKILLGEGNDINTYYLTPGKYKPNAILMLENDKKTELLSIELSLYGGSGKNYRSRSYNLNFGGKFYGRVSTDKKVYSLNESISVDMGIKDQFRNKVSYLLHNNVETDTELTKTVSNNLNTFIQNVKAGFIINTNDEIDEEIVNEEDSIAKIQIKNSCGKVVYEELFSDIGTKEIDLPENFNKGNYKLKVTSKYPNEITSNTRFKVE
ncbi:MAG: S8 family peptidase [Clostridiales bacterium]